MLLLSRNHIDIKFKTNIELWEDAKRLQVDNEMSSVDVYRDFYYFSPLDFTFEGSEFNTKFIVAYHGEEIVGVMKIKRYDRKTHVTVLEEDKEKVNNYLAIRYVDVRVDRRRNGIATFLFEGLNQWIDMDQKVVLSPLTGLGKKAKLKSKTKFVAWKSKLITI